MKIVIEYQERTTIAKFADKHKLVMRVTERENPNFLGETLPRFMADFDYAETKYGSILTSEYGNGNTPAAAIEDYARSISGKLLVIHAMDKKKRREIQVPILTNDKKGKLR